MARKKLNKKVAIIGLAVFAVLVLVLIAVILRFSRSPDKFIKDAEIAAEAKDYVGAERDYYKAFYRAKTDGLKIEILNQLVNLYLDNQDWKKVMGCWERIVEIRPDDYQARLESLNYYYLLADNGITGYWPKVDSLAKDFLDHVDKSVYSEKLPELKSFDKRERKIAGRIDCYIHLIKGIANYEMARRGITAGIEELYDTAIVDLQAAKELEPGNPEVYRHLALAILFRANYLDSKGNLGAKEEGKKQVMQVLEECLNKSEDKMQAEINLLDFKLLYADEKGVEEVRLLEPEYFSLANKYTSSAEVQSKMCEFYLLTGPKYIDKAAGYIEKAVELDKENVLYKIAASTVYYYQFAIHGRKSFDIFKKSVEVAKQARELPDTKDVPGPRNVRNLNNKRVVNEILASRYLEQILERYEPMSESDKSQLISEIKDSVHNIEQVFGSGQNPAVIKWRALIELVEGDRLSAIQRLFSIFEQSMGTPSAAGADAQVSYILAQQFMNTPEQGAVYIFLSTALRSGIARWSRPEAVLDFAELLIRLRFWSQAISSIDTYDELFDKSQRSRTLRIAAYIGAGDFEKADKCISEEPKDSAQSLRLMISLILARIRTIDGTIARNKIETTSAGVFGGEAINIEREEYLLKELKTYQDELGQQVSKLLSIDSNSFENAYIINVFDNYLNGKQVEKAREFIEFVSKKLPDNLTCRLYKVIISEPEPDKLTSARRSEIEEQVFKEIPDSLERAMNLGVFYRNRKDYSKAKEQFSKVIGNYLNEEAKPSRSDEEERTMVVAVDYLFSIALQTEDWDLMSKIENAAKIKDLDDCGGKFYSARIAFLRKENEEALNLYNEILRQRPVFSYAYLYRSNIYAAMGNEQAAIEDAGKANMYNPLDGSVAKNLASLLYARNQKLGNSVTPSQKDELANALDVAMSLNPGDMDLFSFYAEFISQADFQRALAIRQYLLNINPTIDNALLLGRMAAKFASEETNAERKQRLLKLAEETYKKGLAIDENNPLLVFSYAQLLKASGQEKEAEGLIKESKDPNVLWAHYFDNEQYEQAKGVLEQLYKSNPAEPRFLKGLLLVAEKTVSPDDAEKYSRELLAVEDNVDNRILQLKIFVNVGLVEKAESLLKTFREKYPDEPRGKYITAWLSMRRGRLNEALDLANQAVESDENNSLAWQLRGQIYLLMSDYEKAISDFDRSKLLFDDPLTRIMVARAYLGRKLEINAITELKSVVDDPQVGQEATFMLEQIYSRLKRNSELKELYNNCLEKYPDSVFWHIRAAKFALGTGDFKTAEKLYLQAWDKSRNKGSGSHEALNGYLEALLLTKQFDKLFEEAKKYTDSQFASVAYIEMADAEKRIGNLNQAVEYARVAADKAQANDEVFYQTINAMFIVLGKEVVLQYCNDKLKENPNSIAAHAALFNVYNKSGELEKAVSMLDKCIELSGDNKGRLLDFQNRRAWALYNLYVKSSDKNFLTKAIEQYESLIKNVPKTNSADIMNNVAYMLATADERLIDAMEYARQACEIKLNNPEFLDTYGFVLYKNGKFNEADEMMQRALQLFESRQWVISWSFYDRLGMIKEKLGARIQAFAAYNKALETGGQQIPEADTLRIKAAIERVSGE